MKKSLFISLKTKHELYSTLQLVLKWCSENINQEAHVLTWEENKGVINLIEKNTIHFHYIARTKISKMKSSNVIPDYHAVNELWENLESVVKTKWNCIYNTSNDFIGSLLINSLDSETIKGVSFNEDKSLAFSSPWAKYLNEVYPHNWIALNKRFLLSSLCEISPAKNESRKGRGSYLKTYEAIHSLKSKKITDQKILGIDVSAFKDLAWNLNEVVFKLSSNERYTTVFIHKMGDVTEVPVLEKVQEELGKEIFILETDDEAIIDVIASVDLLLTSDTLNKQIALQHSIPTLHIKTKSTPAESVGYSHNARDILIVQEATQMVYEEVLSSMDIILYGKTFTSGDWIFNDIYQVKTDTYGSFLVHINPEDQNLGNLGNYLTRAFFLKEFQEIKVDLETSAIFKLFSPKEIYFFIKNENDILERQSKILMDSLRKLAKVRFEKSGVAEFITTLSELYQNNLTYSTTCCVDLFFRSRLEELHPENNEKLIEDVEKMLYEQRSYYRKVAAFLENLIEYAKTRFDQETASNA